MYQKDFTEFLRNQIKEKFPNNPSETISYYAKEDPQWVIEIKGYHFIIINILFAKILAINLFYNLKNIKKNLGIIFQKILHFRHAGEKQPIQSPKIALKQQLQLLNNKFSDLNKFSFFLILSLRQIIFTKFVYLYLINELFVIFCKN